MNESIRNVEGIGEEFQAKLEYIGIRTATELLAKSQDEEAREELAHRSGIPVGYIENWATMLDLTRIEGVGYQHAELFTYSGIKSVDDFRRRNPDKLYTELKETNDQKHFTGTVPTSETLVKLQGNAKQITDVITRH